MQRNELDKRLSQIQDRLAGIERKAQNRVFLPCEAARVYEVCKFLFSDLGLRFVISTGIDAQDCFEVLHHFSDDESGCLVTVKAFVRDREAPELDSITPLIPGAEWIEREMHDLLGIKFTNHPNLRRLILHDDWPAGKYPLRKDVQK
jgi:NADH-quinone oxidoreductase subunit C